MNTTVCVWAKAHILQLLLFVYDIIKSLEKRLMRLHYLQV